ncbi:hypothetical protein ESY86_15375 [Subsaximicrobium wynnwilliamsii]|uniref:DUF1735 domain-containing protein n=1 Tax=Subsaximicrobium wynnwilliamsii TaxID=291179 RepID=A0A5C6ZE20_9FLAO|nr:hypothetical protein [Subsaximicrobium wynnwilliamsii]TXD82210.1 hypothetical protein ESY87_14965 [Subsaximicrobium wynnwilliamsii]TXD87850.1 hypothetical protein ESY86_15375 [Subsaximicrobium wynnwilliamsii]TXE01800.1 hypothetical protein ESY88_14540 [Subsaximicrobium wynnwilliamsii]
MKATKFFLLCMITLALTACSKEENKRFSNADGPFVRFFLLVNNNNEALEFPEINGGLQPVSVFDKTDIKILKIPVALTYEALSENITVNFESTSSINMSNFNISPNNLSFTPERLIDTIYVGFNERWNPNANTELNFRLTNVSDQNIQIGMPNNDASNETLLVTLGEVNPTYLFETPNQQEIIGTNGEVINFSVLFPKGYLPSELENFNLIEAINSDFNYTLERLPLTNTSTIDYKLTLNEAITIDELEFSAQFKLADLSGYTLSGSSTYSIKKPIVIDRDLSVFTANNFYDLSDPFYRTFGENWIDNSDDGVCEWRSFNAFTFPVVVTADNPNAVLYDDMGNSDSSDDIYHHAFRIGFVSPNDGNTTNSFNLKRWFNNEASNSSNSPGFNIPQALEFFPTNGNSSSDGFVKVIEQDLSISSLEGASYVISISGSGTYTEIATGIFEIQLELNTFNLELFGGTRTVYYHIYNTNEYEELEPISESCFAPIDL